MDRISFFHTKGQCKVTISSCSIGILVILTSLSASLTTPVITFVKVEQDNCIYFLKNTKLLLMHVVDM